MCALRRNVDSSNAPLYLCSLIGLASLCLNPVRVPRLDGVLHYHAVYIKPSWSRGRRPVARIGKHVFYKS